ncbi:MAG: hypothetical protein QXU99_01700 [Candidatus Bathyarchaeia archaeon]
MRKEFALAVVSLVLIGSLSFVVSYAQAFPILNRHGISNAFLGVMNSKPVQKSWLRMDGMITKWGEIDTSGILSVNTRTTLFDTSDTRKLSFASAVWTTDKLRPVANAVKTKENLTYIIYSASLRNASVLSLSYDNNDFLISGKWNINNVTITVTVITNSSGNIVRIHRDTNITTTEAYGELEITDNWTKFTLTISGLDQLTGTVKRSMMRQMQWNPFKITDDIVGTASDTVGKADLTTVAKCYGNMPGWGTYDQRMDFNFNYRIDIADVATVAANVQ